VYSKAGNKEKALTHLSKAKEAGFNSDELHYYFGWAHNLPPADDERTLAEWTSISLNNRAVLERNIAGINYRRGLRLFRGADYKGCIAYLENSLRYYDPSVADGMAPQSFAERQVTNRTDEEKRQTAEVVACLAEAYFQRGLLLYKQDGNYANARSLLQRCYALKANPGYGYRLALAELSLGNIPAGKSLLEKLLEIEPTNVTFRFNLAQVMVKNHENDQAINELQALIEVKDNLRINVQARLLLADCYRANGVGLWQPAL